jgi:O-phospho-L-seryl-tRNASec:L-selenocysteinyl-tRNA synthase
VSGITTKMNESAYSAACRLVPTTTSVQQGRDARRTHERHIRVLIEQRKLPDEGWSNLRIELLLQELALMDSNNFPENVGVGEREGRVFSELVARRHFRLAHGVGRSGDIAAAQPKAAGSSIIAQITNSLLLDLIRHAGVRSAQKCVLLPVATGMALLLVLLTLRQKRPTAHHVIWPRVDQKSCFKCIVSAGFQPEVVENVLEGDELRTDVIAVEEQIRNLGAETVACVFTTTSCFAPRAYDKCVTTFFNFPL